jgi:hypothetical protein
MAVWPAVPSGVRRQDAWHTSQCPVQVRIRTRALPCSRPSAIARARNAVLVSHTGRARPKDVDIVLADGRIETVTPERHPDLFWAVRGGKGNFGVVTSIVFHLASLSTLYGGGLWFEAAGPDSGCEEVMVELRHLGGALARDPMVPNAVGNRDAKFCLATLSPPDRPGDALLSRMAAWGTGRRYLNSSAGH